MLETANFFRAVANKPIAIRIVKDIQRSGSWDCLHNETVWQKGWKLYEKRKDKDWSLTDCLGITVCEERRISDVFTSDHHFQQAGLRILLPSH